MDFVKTYPAIAHRVPQRMLASYSASRQKRSAGSERISRINKGRRLPCSRATRKLTASGGAH